MTPTLWLKFPDEVLFGSRFTDAEKRKLDHIFSAADPQSPWRQALARLGLQGAGPAKALISWHGDAPYFNWSCLVGVISGGAIRAVKTPDGKYVMRVSYKPGDLWALLASQWRIARFLQPKADRKADLAESIALGLALQALVMRLGPEVKNMPAWLAAPEQAPASYRKVIKQIQAVQMRRTEMSHVWKEAFPARFEESETPDSLPDFFWDDALPQDSPATAMSAEKPVDGIWKGLSVCAGKVTGLAVAVPAAPDRAALRDLKEKYNAPLILVFRRARPETTELFGEAGAVLFAEGGVLSHACTVARERGLSSITGLGADFYDLVKNSGKLWLSVDGGGGTAVILPTGPP